MNKFVRRVLASPTEIVFFEHLEQLLKPKGYLVLVNCATQSILDYKKVKDALKRQAKEKWEAKVKNNSDAKQWFFRGSAIYWEKVKWQFGEKVGERPVPEQYYKLILGYFLRSTIDVVIVLGREKCDEYNLEPFTPVLACELLGKRDHPFANGSLDDDQCKNLFRDWMKQVIFGVCGFPLFQLRPRNAASNYQNLLDDFDAELGAKKKMEDWCHLITLHADFTDAKFKMKSRAWSSSK